MVDGGDERRLGARQRRPVQASEPGVQFDLQHQGMNGIKTTRRADACP